MSSPIFRRLGSTNHRNRPFRIAVLGQNGVGKSAFTVRVLTHRYIGDYDPLLENTYTLTTNKCVEGESITMEIRDTVVQVENNRLDISIKWADAFILVYAITDRCSFNECSRLKILVNSYAKPSKGKGQNGPRGPHIMLVGNMTDRNLDRMISTAEGREKAYEMKCLGFYEISVQEERDSAAEIIHELYKRCRRPNLCKSKLQERLSCPPSLQILPSACDDETKGEHSRTEFGSLPGHRSRTRALFTIS